MKIMVIRETIRAHRDRILLVIIIVALVGTYLLYGLRSDGVYYDDDIAHFLIAKFSWRHRCFSSIHGAGRLSPYSMPRLPGSVLKLFACGVR